MLELAILGLLKERSMHGYQLSKRLEDTLGGFWRVSYGSLYPTLRRLQKDGAVEPVFSKDDVGRRKNVYRITEKGEVLFDELLSEVGQETWEDNRFRVRLAFFRYLKPETRIRLLERRRAYLEERLSTIKTSLKNARERIDNYTLSLMHHGHDATEHDIAWLDDLINAERRQVQAEMANGNGAAKAEADAPRSRPARRTTPTPRTAALPTTKERA